MNPPLPPSAGLRPYFYIPENDLTALTFFFSMFALVGAAVFFFMERRNVPRRWHTNVTVAGLICLVAGISYYHMQGLYINQGVSPTRFRYMEWLFTVPLMCTQFYLLLRPAGAQSGSLWRLVLGAVWMIGFGYFGEDAGPNKGIIFGALSTLGYLLILFEVWFGPLAKVVDRSANREVVRAFRHLSFFVLIGWALYPLGYMTLPFNVFEKLNLDRNLVYNFADVINKIGFGLVVYVMARKAGAGEAASKAASKDVRAPQRRVRQSELVEAGA